MLSNVHAKTTTTTTITTTTVTASVEIHDSVCVQVAAVDRSSLQSCPGITSWSGDETRTRMKSMAMRINIHSYYIVLI